jgi:serine/threonine protein kinase
MGGMATVHRAIERGIDGFERVVALKRLLPHLAEDVDFVRAFVREAKLASMLQHGNIVQLYELGRVGASYFISMEYIPGRDLRVLLRQARRVSGPPPIEISIALMTELLDALDYAHSQVGSDGKPLGLIHRDISPANLIVGNTGHLKVIDFGIAKATFGHLMTHSGRIKGKLSYMAPEALAGRTLDGRSDLFSASIIAHELITATPLFAAKDDFHIIDRLQNMTPPAPSSRNPSCPAELDRIVLRGLAKDPDKRWRSTGEMRAAIAELALDQRLLATNREVTGWVEEAFQHPEPAAQQRRLRMPLAAPPAEALERRGSSGGESEDDVMDIVWGGNSPRSMQVVLDEVPDVTDKLPLAASSGYAPDPRPVHRSDASLILGSASSASQRTGPLGMTGLGMGGQITGQSSSAWSTGNLRQVTDPTGWAVGTGPTAPQQSQAMLEEAMLAARRAEVMALAAMATRRRSLAPLLIASVAVTAAGAAIAWFITNRDRPAQVAAAAPQGAQLPASAQPAAPQPAPPPVQNVVTASPGAVAEPAPIAATPEPAAPARRAPAEPADNEAVDDARADDKPARKAKAKREAALAARERAKEEERAAAEEAQKEERAAISEKAADEARSAPSAQPARQQTRTTDATKPDLAPLPVPVQPPVTRPAEPTRPRPSGPIVVSAARAQRQSGNTRPIRFPPGEALPPKVTAKLCIDTRGIVTSVTVLSTVTPKVRRAIERGLESWRYRPVMEGGQAVAACFATAFPVHLD